nr:transposase [Nitrosomonas communis]
MSNSWSKAQLVTKVRKNMKNKLLPLFDKLLLRKRSIIDDRQ